jgi:hypothetical protein
MSFKDETWEVIDRHLEPRYVVLLDTSGDFGNGFTGICQPDRSEDCYSISAVPSMYRALQLAKAEIILSGNWMADFGWKAACKAIDLALDKAEGKEG